jgi:tetratricopeptide (TPR) repeat protein
MRIMATKIGRNEFCPCGSGKKYKRCCLEQDEQDQREAALALAATMADQQAQDDEFAEWSDALDDASNAVVDLIEADKLDHAEKAARELLENFPEVHDGYDRLGMVYEARGEPKKAADCYRKVVAFMQAHPTDYDAELLASFEDLLQKLDPSDPSAQST